MSLLLMNEGYPHLWDRSEPVCGEQPRAYHWHFHTLDFYRHPVKNPGWDRPDTRTQSIRCLQSKQVSKGVFYLVDLVRQQILDPWSSRHFYWSACRSGEGAWMWISDLAGLLTSERPWPNISNVLSNLKWGGAGQETSADLTQFKVAREACFAKCAF